MFNEVTMTITSITDRCAAVMAGALPCSAFGNAPDHEFRLVDGHLQAIYEAYISLPDDTERLVDLAYRDLATRVSPAYQLGFHDTLMESPIRTKTMREFYVKDMAF